MKKILLFNIGLILFSVLDAQQTQSIAVNRLKTADRQVNSLRQLLITKDTTVKKTSTKKPYNQLPKKPADAIEVKKNH